MMSLPLGPWLVSVERMSHFQCVSSELALCHMGCRGHRRLDGNINQYAWPYVTTPGVLLGHWLWRNLQMSEERGVQCHHMHYILKGQITQITEKKHITDYSMSRVLRHCIILVLFVQVLTVLP